MDISSYTARGRRLYIGVEYTASGQSSEELGVSNYTNYKMIKIKLERTVSVLVFAGSVNSTNFVL